MTEAAWRSLYVSFAYNYASLIYTSLSRPKAVHVSGVHCSRLRVRIGVRIRFSVSLVRCYAHVFVLLSTVFVTLPFVGLCSR